MKPESCYISVGNLRLHYLKTGGGRRLLIGFHGYGHDANSLLLLAPYLQEEYTCLFIDLPYHGLSTSPIQTFTKHMLKKITEQLLTEHNASTISLLGYSMGGRVCLNIIELMPDKVDKVTLIASDGLAPNGYYIFFTRTIIGKALFTNMLNKPGRYMKIVDWLNKNKWITDWQYKFVQYYTGDENNRKKLGLIWPAMRQLLPDLSVVKKNIAKYDIHINLVMGKFDKVIPARLADRFAGRMIGVTITTLNKGHRVITPDTAETIAQTLI
jgi:pimeloyl-ACP methyl ester carboxylesterase